jgi:hypothetical protein
MLWVFYPASKAIAQFTEIMFRLSVDCDQYPLFYSVISFYTILSFYIISPSLLVLSIYINVFIIAIHIMPDTFGYIWLAVSATTVILRGRVMYTHSLFWTRFYLNN